MGGGLLPGASGFVFHFLGEKVKLQVIVVVVVPFLMVSVAGIFSKASVIVLRFNFVYFFPLNYGNSTCEFSA